MIRAIASTVILGGCAYLGNLFALSCKKRHRQLRELGQIVAQLEFDIDFLGTPLNESLNKISLQYTDGIGDVLKYVCSGMRGEHCVDMGKLWESAFERFGNELSLRDEDIAIMLEFSKKLGRGNREHEKNNLKGTSMRLKIAEDEAREVAKTNVKMYRGLGVLAGVFIVIVLI